MRWNFGDRDMQEEMKTNPLLRFDPAFEQKPTRALREKDYLVSKVGINLYQAVSQTYEAYLAKPVEKTATGSFRSARFCQNGVVLRWNVGNFARKYTFRNRFDERSVRNSVELSRSRRIVCQICRKYGDFVALHQRNLGNGREKQHFQAPVGFLSQCFGSVRVGNFNFPVWKAKRQHER